MNEAITKGKENDQLHSRIVALNGNILYTFIMFVSLMYINYKFNERQPTYVKRQKTKLRKKNQNRKAQRETTNKRINNDKENNLFP